MLEHTVEVFEDAVYQLVRRGSWDSRLKLALERLSVLAATEVPAEVKPAFEDLSRQMSASKPVPNEGSIEALIREMTEDDYEECIQSILDMYAKVIVSAARFNKQP